MEILALLETNEVSTVRQVGSVVAVFLCSWRFGIGVLM